LECQVVDLQTSVVQSFRDFRIEMQAMRAEFQQLNSTRSGSTPNPASQSTTTANISAAIPPSHPPPPEAMVEGNS
jgi:hypothetical protein